METVSVKFYIWFQLTETYDGVRKATHHKPKGEYTVKKETTSADSSANPWMFVSLFLGALLVASFVTNIYFLDTVTSGIGPAAANAPGVPSQPNQPSQPSAPAAPVKVEARGPSIGKANAPVTIIEFSDFQCAFCKRYNDQTAGQLKENYVKKGKVRIA